MGNHASHRSECLVGNSPDHPLPASSVRYLALGAGSVRGVALLGAYAELVKRGMDVSQLLGLSGCSVGSILGLAIVLNMTMEEMMTIATSPVYQQLSTAVEYSFSCGRASFINTQALREQMVEILGKHGLSPEITFQDLKRYRSILFSVVAFDLHEKKMFSFNHETAPGYSVVDAIMASSAMPVVFPPQAILMQDKVVHCFVDGAVEVELPLHEFPISTTLGLYLYDCYRSRRVAGSFFAENRLTKEERDHIVSIDVSRVSPTQFTPTRAILEWLIRQGREAIAKYYENPSPFLSANRFKV